MVPSLNKFLFVLLILSFSSFGQNIITYTKDYQNSDQFKNFGKRRKEVAKWHINQLKNGALLVRLATNKKTIEILRKNGKEDIATQKEHETFAINKNIVRAFSKNYTFSKVYFFYSNFSDTLLKGARQGIFLDTNLVLDPSIKMTEEFYLLAEKDFAYNSSIGFVKEDTAKFISETGGGVKEMAVIVKNKYGHQLKEPFPYSTIARGSPTAVVISYISYVPVNTIPSLEIKDLPKIKVSLSKKYSAEKYAGYIRNFNVGLHKFYSQNKNYEVTDPDVKPFLY